MPKQSLLSLKGVFNFTMTYRLDADIYAPFGHFDRIANASDEVAADTKNFTAGTKNFAAGKTKMAAWFVSNCFDKSRRMQ